MKEATVNIFRKVSHVILVILSMALSINLFIQFSDQRFIQILFGAMAFSFELIKLYILMLAKENFHISSIKSDIVATIQFTVYLGLAIMSIVASLGFALVSIEEQSLSSVARTEVSNFRVDQLKNKLESNNKQIEIIQQNASNLEFSAVERNAEANRQVLEIQALNEEIVNQIEELREEKASEAEENIKLTSADMFSLLGESVNLSGKDTMFYMMLILVFFLELAIAITSGSIKKEFSINISGDSEIKIAFNYIDALFSNEKDTRLLSDKRITALTGIPIESCKKFREALQSITYKGKSLISSVPGSTKPNFSKENIKKIIRFRINNGLNF